MSNFKGRAPTQKASKVKLQNLRVIYQVTHFASFGVKLFHKIAMCNFPFLVCQDLLRLSNSSTSGVEPSSVRRDGSSLMFHSNNMFRVPMSQSDLLITSVHHSRHAVAPWHAQKYITTLQESKGITKNCSESA